MNKPPVITVQWLRSIDACEDGQEAFIRYTRKMPFGIPIERLRGVLLNSAYLSAFRPGITDWLYTFMWWLLHGFSPTLKISMTNFINEKWPEDKNYHLSFEEHTYEIILQACELMELPRRK